MAEGFALVLNGAAEQLQTKLKESDGSVGDMLGGWQGVAGGAYSSAWQLWHSGAGEVQLGLSMLAKAVAQAGMSLADNESHAAEVMREIHNG